MRFSGFRVDKVLWNLIRTLGSKPEFSPQTEYPGPITAIPETAQSPDDEQKWFVVEGSQVTPRTPNPQA